MNFLKVDQTDVSNYWKYFVFTQTKHDVNVAQKQLHALFNLIQTRQRFWDMSLQLQINNEQSQVLSLNIFIVFKWNIAQENTKSSATEKKTDHKQ